MRVESLLPGFAAEVRGVSIGRIDDGVGRRLRDVFRRYAVLVLPGQGDASRDQFQQFATVFGHASGCADITNLDANDRIMAPTSLDARYARGNDLWHMDMPVMERPPLAAMLLARELPLSGGGQTQFADLQAAWRSLATARKHSLRKMRAVHSIEAVRRKVGIVDEDELISEYGPGEHPLVSVDPHTGKPTLLFSAHSSRIVGWSRQASADLFGELLRITTQRVYTHKWRMNDLLLWSNRRAMHRALPYDHRGERRRLWRAEILASESPAPYRPWWSRFMDSGR